MSRYKGDDLNDLRGDDSLTALYKTIRRLEDEEEVPTIILMKNGTFRKPSGSHERRARVSRKAQSSRRRAGRPKNRVKRKQFQTTIASETQDMLRERKMRLSTVLDSWLRTLDDGED